MSAVRSRLFAVKKPSQEHSVRMLPTPNASKIADKFLHHVSPLAIAKLEPAMTLARELA